MAVTLETQQRIAELRIKAKSPEGLSLDEVREGIAFLRQERLNMTPAKTKPKAQAVNADDLLSELGL